MEGQCSGTLLDDQTVITSAHCLTQMETIESGQVKKTVAHGTGWSVYGNFEGKQIWEDGARREVVMHSTFPLYNYHKSSIHDVALVFVQPFSINKTVEFISLPLPTG
jgi:V8-like Glu-specific endopeptidase